MLFTIRLNKSQASCLCLIFSNAPSKQSPGWQLAFEESFRLFEMGFLPRSPLGRVGYRTEFACHPCIWVPLITGWHLGISVFDSIPPDIAYSTLYVLFAGDDLRDISLLFGASPKWP